MKRNLLRGVLLLLTVTIFTFSLGSFQPNVSATTVKSTEETITEESLEEAIEDLKNEFGEDALTVTDIAEVSEQSTIHNFESTAKFKEAISGYLSSQEEDVTPIYESYFPLEDNDVITPPIYDSPTKPTFAPEKGASINATTKPGSARIKWHPYSYNPFKNQFLPYAMWIDFTFNYTGSGKNKKFSKVKQIVAVSDGLISDWHKTTNPYASFYDSNKGVKITIQGYHLVGINIKGVGIGMKIPETYTKKYHF